MKPLLLLLLSLFCVGLYSANGQSETLPKTPTHADSVYLAKMNTNANLMIAGGVGLCVVGGYLIYQGLKVYNTRTNGNKPLDPSQVATNKKQGTAYLAGAGVGIAAGIVLVALGARNKVDFKRRKKEMALHYGVLDSGQLGLALSF